MPLRQKLDELSAEAGYARLDLNAHAKRLSRLERRLGKSLLDSFVDGFFEAVATIPIGFGEHSELTIATGLVTKTFIYHTIDTQADAASDNLAGIRNGKDGDPLIIRPDSDARSIVVKHNDVAEGVAGSRIFLNGDADLTLDDVDDTLTLIYDETLDSASGAWAEVARGQQAHNLLSATHTDALAGTVVDGDIIIGNVTPKWSRLAISIPAATVRNVLGIDNAELRPSWKTALDATAPSTSAVGDAAAAGTSLVFSHRDHAHGREAFATNTFALGTAAAAGIAATLIRSDAGIAAFDVTAPTTIAPSDAPTAGVINFAARRDHLHGAPATFPATAHDLLSATHTDALAGTVVDGDIIIGNVTPKWSSLAISVPAAGVRNVLGIDNAELRPSWKTALDATGPADIASSASAGTSLIFSHRDHAHRGVLSVNKLAAATLYGAVTLSEGAGVTLTQVGQDIAIAAGGGAAHNIFSATHSDTTGAASPVDGDIIIANVTPAWSKLAISIPAATVRNVLGIDNAELRPSWKTALDATNPADIAAATGPGTSLLFSHRDHVHAHPNLGDLHTGYLLATGARAGSTSQAQSFGATGIQADIIAESTAAAGVTVDGLLIKDKGISSTQAAAAMVWVESKVTGDAVDRFQITVDGKLNWGDGGGLDTELSRSAANTLTLGANDVFMVPTLATNTINEFTAATGVTVDGLLIKDEYIEFDERAAPGAGAANKLRLYAKDYSAQAGAFYVDDGGNEFWLADTIFRSMPLTGVAANWATGVSGTGVANVALGYLDTSTGGATGVARISGGNPYLGITRGSAIDVINWSRRLLLKVRFAINQGGASGISRICLGKSNSQSAGDLAAKGIGIKVTTLTLVGQVHDGTTLTNTATLATLTAGQVYDLLIISRGSDTVEWFLDDVSIGTSTGSPTGLGVAANNAFRLESTASAAATHQTLVFYYGWADLAA